jgi:hypothetical protein
MRLTKDKKEDALGRVRRGDGEGKETPRRRRMCCSPTYQEFPTTESTISRQTGAFMPGYKLVVVGQFEGTTSQYDTIIQAAISARRSRLDRVKSGRAIGAPPAVACPLQPS